MTPKRKRHGRALGETFSLLLLAAISVPPSAAADPGSVLCFDEVHLNVHRAAATYQPVVRLAAEVGLSLRVLDAPWSAEALAGCGVLLSAGARGAGRDRPLSERGRPAFGEDEVRAVAAWVEGGGSLLLVTDHAPIGGAAAPLAEWLGVEMSDAFTEDPDHQGPQPGELVFSRSAGLLGDHPITRGRSPGERVESVSTFLGQSMKGPPGSSDLLILGPNAKDRRRRSPDGFTWADLSPEDPLLPAGGRSQALAMEVGAGRVVVLGEAAMLTERGLAGSPEKGGNRQFAVNLLRWLSRQLPMPQ